MRRLLLLVLVLTAMTAMTAMTPVTSVAASARDGEVVSTTSPTVTGRPTFGRVLTARPGRWEPSAVTYAYRWLRDGAPVRGATTPTYRLDADDLGHRMSVVVIATATDGSGARGTATSAPTTRVVRAELRNRHLPRATGDLRYGHTIAATTGRWSVEPDRLRYQWLRGGKPIAGARQARHALAPEDVGRRIRVEVTAVAEGHQPLTVRSDAVVPTHRVGVKRSVTYSVVTRGHVTADLREFRRQVQQTYDDPRGWRAKGVAFRRVARGGSFTVVLAQASTVPSYSSGCSAEWSCRVGRYVIINQTRWLHASPAWNAGGLSTRDYRHMVVNHETGHWLGRGHVGCPAPGALAPVMMQQSKGRDGCRFNPWPTPAELR